MGEIKSVKVDNWGVFFLQKLQNFFNKTDYCDLTLQFNDNSQLKVHRLVLSACTDYFNVLEQTCEVIDDALLMPNELQADVVVPIVNFMYTGTLEFELKMYGKLLRTAKEMNMTVLLKLLEAHRRTMEGVNRAQQRPSSPKNIRKRGPASQTSPHAQMRPVPNSPQQQQQQQQRRILATANAAPQRRLVQTKLMTTNANQPPQIQPYHQQIGSTSLLKTSVSATSPLKIQRNTFESSSYGSGTNIHETTMQFKEEQQDDYETQLTTINQSTSPFEELRKGYNNNKRPASATFISPPAKKPNIEDVKEFAEQQRMRKQIAAEYGEDQEYEGPMLDDDIHNDDDEDDAGGAAVASSSVASTSTTTTTNVKQHQQSPSIIIKQEPNEKPTIVVKDSANSKMNHAKIISEVLRQYPHLVKSNKNIKLKIMPNMGGGHSQKIIVKKEQIDNISAEMTSAATNSGGHSQNSVRAAVAQHTTVSKPVEKPSQPTPAPQQLLRQAQKSPAVASSTATAAITTTIPPSATAVPAQKRRIDSKTMHALIAQGAENTTGPWLCLRCGVNGRPISIPSYRGFRRHLINTHKETIDPALCEHCGWRSTTNQELHFHIQVEHKIKTSVYTFPECLMCAEIFLDSDALNDHMVESHPDENQQQCIYCNKIFAKEMQLYTHMKTYHKKQAIDDGIIDYSDDDEETMAQDDEAPNESMEDRPKQPQNTNIDKKIKILSDISLPSAGSLMKLEPSSEAAALTTIASGIATSIGLETSEEYINATGEATTANTDTVNETQTEPKFVTADGNEMVLTEEQRKEIMSQLNQEHEGGVVMVLNETPFSDANVAADTNEDTSQDIAPDQNEEQATHAESAAVENMEASADEEDYDPNNIYSDFVNKSEREAKKDSSGLEESKGSMDNLEWAENLITAHEMEEETNTKASTKGKEVRGSNVEDSAKERKQNEEDISKKLKELTGDWSDDEIDDDEEMVDESAKHIDDVDKDEKSEGAEVVENTEIVGEIKEVSDIEKEDDEEHMSETNKLTENAAMSKKHRDESGENDEPEDDIDMALKSLHQGYEETTDENVTDETHKKLDLTDESNVKEANVSSEIEEEKIESTEEPEIKNIELAYEESDTGAAAIEKKSKVSKEEDASSDVAGKSIKSAKDVSKGSDDEDAPQEVNEETKEEKDKTNVNPKSNEKDIKIEECEEEDEDMDAENTNVDLNLAEPQDTKKDSKSSSIVAETSKISETTTSSTADSPTTVTTSTEDKVKTLISDWGDDDEDEIEDIGTLM